MLAVAAEEPGRPFDTARTAIYGAAKAADRPDT
jgi:hypothetical protein